MQRIIKKYFIIMLLLMGTLTFMAGSAAAINMDESQNGIPVLMYHSIGYVKDNGLVMTPEKFRSQIKYIKDNGYTTLTLDELHALFKGNKPIPQKLVVITLDDGYSDNYKYAYPILKEYGAKATIFVITKTIDGKNTSYLNSEQIKELQANGIDIQSHTAGHEDLSTLTYEKQLKTLKESKGELEKLLNKSVNYIAYPFGKYNNETVKAAKEAGYLMGLTTKNRSAKKSDGMYTLSRKNINSLDEMGVFIGRLKK